MVDDSARGARVRRTRPAGRRWLAGVVLGSLITVLAPRAAAELRVVYQDRFSGSEQARVDDWLVRVLAAQASLVGEFPFEVMAYVRRGWRGYEPVYGGRTERFRAQGVYLTVDPAAGMDALLGSWKAPHEFSHLILPYVGRRNSWFSEGFASYMQYQVMHALNVVTADELRARYRQRLEQARADYGYPQRPFIRAAADLRARREYPTLYWGGAAFFLQIAAELGGDAELMALLRRYLAQGRPDRAGLPAVLDALDAVAGRPLFTANYRRWRDQPGFPDLTGLALPVTPRDAAAVRNGADAGSGGS